MAASTASHSNRRDSQNVQRVFYGFRHVIGTFLHPALRRDPRRLPNHVIRYRTPNVIDACRGNMRQREAITKNSGGMAGICHNGASCVTGCQIFFALPIFLWYLSTMMKSYVGIVSKSGIELFYPEDPVTVRFLWRRAQRQKGKVACVWGVLSSEAAELVQLEISLGWTREALDHLQQHARDYGFIVPYREELESPFVSRAVAQ